MRYILLLIIFFPVICLAKTLIITHNYNRPEFIALQNKTFKKFLSHEFDFVVFSDATSQEMDQKIKQACQENNVRYMRIPQAIHTQPYLPRNPHDNLQQANIRHANCVQYSLDTIGFDYDGTVCILDSDMFLIRNFSIEEYMKDRDIAAFIKRAPEDIYCLCPVLCFLKMKTLPDKKTLDFNTGRIKGWAVDSGGYTYFYLIDHPQLKIQSINFMYSHQLFLADNHLNRLADHSIPKEVKEAFYTSLNFNKKEIKFLLEKPDTFEFYLDYNFLHYRDGSNDTRQSADYHVKKFAMFNNFFNDILQ